MSFLRFYTSLCFKYLLISIFVFSLAACSVSQPEAILGGDSTPANNTDVFGVSWNAPLYREDGTSLELIEIAEYRVYYGIKSGDYENIIVVDGNSTLEAKDSTVAKGTYYVAVTAVDSDGRESAYSQEIVITV